MGRGAAVTLAFPPGSLQPSFAGPLPSLSIPFVFTQTSQSPSRARCWKLQRPPEPVVCGAGSLLVVSPRSPQGTPG